MPSIMNLAFRYSGACCSPPSTGRRRAAWADVMVNWNLPPKRVSQEAASGLVAVHDQRPLRVDQFKGGHQDGAILELSACMVAYCSAIFFLGLPFGQPPFLAFSLAASALAALVARPALAATTGPML